MQPMTKIVIHYVNVLLLDGFIVKINDSPFCWGPTWTPSWTPGGPRNPLWKPLLEPTNKSELGNTCYINKTLTVMTNKKLALKWFIKRYCPLVSGKQTAQSQAPLFSHWIPVGRGAIPGGCWEIESSRTSLADINCTVEYTSQKPPLFIRAVVDSIRNLSCWLCC